MGTAPFSAKVQRGRKDLPGVVPAATGYIQVPYGSKCGAVLHGTALPVAFINAARTHAEFRGFFQAASFLLQTTEIVQNGRGQQCPSRRIVLGQCQSSPV